MKAHVARILTKLSARDRAQLIVIAYTSHGSSARTSLIIQHHSELAHR